jgi:hypothetical protein
MTPHEDPRWQAEAAKCAEYWTWLYAERRRRQQEPSPEEKRAFIERQERQ